MTTFEKLLAAGVVGVGGYFAYTELVRPYLLKRKLEEQAATLAAAKGISYQDALAEIGAKACQGLAASYGIPPGQSGDACALAGKLAVVAGKYAVKGAIIAGKEIGKGAAVGAKAVAHAAVATEHAVVGAGKTAVHAAESAVKAPVNLVKKLKFWGLEGLHC